MKISENFTLEEFLVSQTATRHGIDMTPPPVIEAKIIRLVETVIQPLRTELGTPIMISSGYRPKDLNSLIGGSKTSAHIWGCAADMRCNALTPLGLAQLAVDMALPFDQVIHEFGRWVHIGINWNSNALRYETLTAYKAPDTRYIHGLHSMESLA
jgi:hypothetical protein